MIEKNHLQSIISRYYLGGLIESVKWEIQNNTLNIAFMSPNKDMIGELECNEFPIEDCELAIFNTTQLNKLLGVTSGQLLISPIKFRISYTVRIGKGVARFTRILFISVIVYADNNS